jgi:hypothetical protein
LRKKLEEQGIPVWLDEEDLKVGHQWSCTIQKAIEDCACLILICTPASIRSKEVSKEWRYAVDLAKPILPLMRVKCILPKEIKILHYLDFTFSEIFSESLNKLLSELETFSFSLASPVLELSHNLLSWPKVSGAGHYIVERSSDNKFVEDINAKSVNFYNFDIARYARSKQKFYYRVKAASKGAVNDSGWSNTVEVGGRNQSTEKLYKLLDKIKQEGSGRD